MRLLLWEKYPFYIRKESIMNENYQDLANEIAAQAARDYERALIKEREGKLERKEIEEFFICVLCFFSRF